MSRADHGNRKLQYWRGGARVHRLLAALVTLLVSIAALTPARHAAAQELQERFAAHDPSSSLRVDHSAWDRLLKQYLHPAEDGLNRFDYAGLKENGLDELDAYLERLQTLDPARLSRDEQFAFWTNLYNAKTVEIVTRRYPVKSIRDIRMSNFLIPGPWREKVVTVSGVPLSLDDIEHGILRPIWQDARIHYAVNCASVGCPSLLKRAYTGAALDKMLNEAARSYINSPRGVRFDGGSIIASSLYSWYAKDFGGSEARIFAHMRKYAEPPLAGRLGGAAKISGYAYDWDLNDKR